MGVFASGPVEVGVRDCTFGPPRPTWRRSGPRTPSRARPPPSSGSATSASWPAPGRSSGSRGRPPGSGSRLGLRPALADARPRRPGRDRLARSARLAGGRQPLRPDRRLPPASPGVEPPPADPDLRRLGRRPAPRSANRARSPSTSPPGKTATRSRPWRRTLRADPGLPARLAPPGPAATGRPPGPVGPAPRAGRPGPAPGPVPPDRRLDAPAGAGARRRPAPRSRLDRRPRRRARRPPRRRPMTRCESMPLVLPTPRRPAGNPQRRGRRPRPRRGSDPDANAHRPRAATDPPAAVAPRRPPAEARSDRPRRPAADPHVIRTAEQFLEALDGRGRGRGPWSSPPTPTGPYRLAGSGGARPG